MSNMIIDFHTHAFPDSIAARAIPALEAEAHSRAYHNGKVSSLLACMDRAGIDRAVVLSIATKPGQFDSILKWSKSIESPRLIPFASLHPADPEAPARVRQIRDAGLKGLKLHPYYQEFDLAEKRLFPIYEAIQDCGLILVSHTGFDIAFPRDRKADPRQIMEVVRAFPRLKLVTSHLGAWEDWDEVKKHMIGRPVYMEISFSLERLPPREARELILAHPREYVLFGSDSPWTDSEAALRLLRSLRLDDATMEAILHANAQRFLAVKLVVGNSPKSEGCR